MTDAWRLAVGTFTAIPVKPPRTVDRTTTGRAIVLAPLAALPLGALVALTLWLGRELSLNAWAVSAAAVGLLALGSRAFHLDGLSDTADGLTASYDRERALAVLKTGPAGPAGAAALVIVLGIQMAALVSFQVATWGPVAAGLVVSVSRAAAIAGCVRGVPGARPDGLGSAYAGTVSRLTAGLVAIAALAALTGSALLAGAAWWLGPVAGLLAGAAVAWLVRRAITRFGGIVGDVLGASVEIALAVLLLALS